LKQEGFVDMRLSENFIILSFSNDKEDEAVKIVESLYKNKMDKVTTIKISAVTNLSVFADKLRSKFSKEHTIEVNPEAGFCEQGGEIIIYHPKTPKAVNA